MMALQNLPRLRASSATAAREPASPRLLPSLRVGWQQLRFLQNRLNNSALGDAIGLACVIGTFLFFYTLTA